MQKPMLAHKFDESIELTGLNLCTYKLSLTVYVVSLLKMVRILVQVKHFKNLAHIELALIPFFKQNPDVILDGELYNHKLKNDFEKIISLVRKQKPTADDRRRCSTSCAVSRIRLL